MNFYSRKNNNRNVTHLWSRQQRIKTVWHVSVYRQANHFAIQTGLHLLLDNSGLMQIDQRLVITTIGVRKALR